MSKTNLTPQEQIKLVNGGSFFGTSAIEEKDIPRLQLLDGGTGINFEQFFGDLLSREGKTGIGGDALRAVLKNFYTPEKITDDDAKELYNWIYKKLEEIIPDMTAPGCYPPGIFLGATWNPEVIYKVGQALGQEAKAYGVNVLLGTPNVNIHRDVRNGRLFEGYSEDPCLASKLSPEIVKGVQSEGVAANVKHFAANHQETNRMNINEHIPVRALHEIYYPGFRACVKSGVATVMSAYNQINGVPCTENHELLTELLRDEWGFDGVVMSDWNAVYHPAEAVNAGNDLAMPGPIAPDKLLKAYEDGTLLKDALERSALRMEKFAEKYAQKATGFIDREKTDKIAYDAASEGIILLKNNGVLPLDESADIALYGEYAEYLLTCGEGSAGIHTDRNVSFMDSLADNFRNVLFNAQEDNCDTLIYVYSLPGQEGNDRKDISIPKNIKEEMNKLLDIADEKDLRKILILNVSGPVALDELEERFDGILCVFLPGMQGAKALADCLCGKINPSGKLPLTWPEKIEDMPTYLNFPGDGMQVYYGEGIFVGYRWYDARNIKPLYPFGYGLSYTDFEITDIRADRKEFTDNVIVTVTVKNIGDRAGKTVVQLYVNDSRSSLTKPVKELRAFEKVWLEMGEEKTLSFTLKRHDFESYDPNLNKWTMEEGYYRISAGLSSRDLQAECTVYAGVKSPYSYGSQTSIKVIYEDERLYETLKGFFEERGLAWSAVLTSYEYTAQDTLELILCQVECPQSDREVLFDRMSRIRKE